MKTVDNIIIAKDTRVGAIIVIYLVEEKSTGKEFTVEVRVGLDEECPHLYGKILVNPMFLTSFLMDDRNVSVNKHGFVITQGNRLEIRRKELGNLMQYKVPYSHRENATNLVRFLNAWLSLNQNRKKYSRPKPLWNSHDLYFNGEVLYEK